MFLIRLRTGTCILSLGNFQMISVTFFRLPEKKSLGFSGLKKRQHFHIGKNAPELWVVSVYRVMSEHVVPPVMRSEYRKIIYLL